MAGGLTDKEEEANVFRTALIRTLAAVVAAHVFLIAIYRGMVPGLKPEQAEEWYTCYVLEESLSMDNLFAFYMVFLYFKVPTGSQERVLRWGILGAVVFRAAMISAGAVMVRSFHSVLLLFAAILLFQGIKIVRDGGGGDDGSDETDLAESSVVKVAQLFVPVSAEYSGDAFFVQKGGSYRCTPLVLVLLVIEMSDIVFAIDSVPAAFGSSEAPAVIFTANIFAILSLRSLYAVVAHAVDDLPFLETAIGAVLVFLGAKMFGEAAGIAISTTASLCIVFALLGAGALASVAKHRQWGTSVRNSDIKHI
mmetsp:Transcript_21514/g.64001  ORF Transcript_21514/g.64001 Transcript_21514/m.64001 type:complete len:308 (-) Transcript_21514:59-982(-)